MTVMSWCTSPPFVYISENVGLAGNKATWDEQIGLPPPPLLMLWQRGVFGSPICAIASEKLTVGGDGLDRSVPRFWWSMAMIPLCYVVLLLIVGLNEATGK